MSQVPITPAVSPQTSTGISQASNSAVSATAGDDGLEGAPELNFGAVFAKQLKGVASLLGQKEDVRSSFVVADETTGPDANAGAMILPVDLSVLTSSMLVPGAPAQAAVTVPVSPAHAGAGAGITAEASTETPMVQLPKASVVQLAADIAVNGKILPAAVSAEESFADKLATLVKVPVDIAGGELHSTDLPAAVNPSATAVVFQKSESLPALPVVPRVGSPDWGGAVGEKVVWMANQSHQVAELHLNPPNLGPLEVRLTIINDQASALFVSHHSAVREAIETALPRLREMLADNGIMLGNVTVGSESFGQQQAFQQGNGKQGGRSGMEAENIMARMAVSGRPAGLMRDGMVDIFA